MGIRPPYTKELLESICAERGGVYLGTDKPRQKTKEKYRCVAGHEWETSPTNIVMGKWCNECHNLSKRFSIDDYKELAKSKGLTVADYNNPTSTKSNVGWKCQHDDHPVFYAKYDTLSRSTANGCAICSQRVPYTKEQMDKHAEKMGGKYLGSCKPRNHLKEVWECSAGHQWSAICSSIIAKGCWCPDCTKYSRGEAETREAMWNFCSSSFEKCRPEWLRRHKLGHPMEMDGYSPELGLCFEYQGLQHYSKVAFFHKSDETFYETRKRDAMKAEWISARGIMLLDVPQAKNTKTSTIKAAIERRSAELALPFPCNPDFSRMLSEHGILWDAKRYAATRSWDI